MSAPAGGLARCATRIGAPWRGLRRASRRSRNWRWGCHRSSMNATLARLRRLSLVAGQARTEGLAGEHRSRRRGTSPEFADFKRYSPGDDFRRIDWNTYARLGGLFVRLSEVTTELSVHILLDSSASMDWRGADDRPSKFTAARRLTAALAYVALWGFDRVSHRALRGAARAFPMARCRAGRRSSPTIRYLERLQADGRHSPGDGGHPPTRGPARARVCSCSISDLLSGEPDGVAGGAA